MAEFYTSGRTSNEAAFIYQVFVREFGTNNFPDCSNMCHEATSVGLPDSIGVGKGTVTLEDFDHADVVFCMGHNPGTNHPRMLSTLREVSKRGGTIVVFNPLKERGLERFLSPQHPVEMLTGRATKIASVYHQVRVGGDAAVMKGLMKALLALDGKNGRQVIDRAFIAEHTAGYEALVQDIKATKWKDIERCSGLTRREIESTAEIYANAKNVIFCYGMGLTQHRHGTQVVQQLANLMLMRGQIGREGAGICPLRGHSNVQGDRTVGITEIPNAELLDRLEATFGFKPPREHGHGAVEAIKAMAEGPLESARLHGRQPAGRDVRPRGVLRRHAQAGPRRAHRHQAQSLASAAGQDVDHPAVPWAHRARRAGDGPAVGDGRRFHVGGARVGRPPEAGLARSQIGARHRRRHRQGDAAQHQGRLGWIRRRLQHSSATRSRRCFPPSPTSTSACASRAASASTLPRPSASG